MGRRDVDCGEEGGEERVGGEEGEVEDEEDEAVFAAIVGEGEGGEAGFFFEREKMSAELFPLSLGYFSGKMGEGLGGGSFTGICLELLG